MTRIPLLDLSIQRDRLRSQIDAAIDGVLDHGQFIMGPEVLDFENRLKVLSGVDHAVSCGNGTDALVIMLMAAGIGPRDAVFIPSFTFAATAEAVAQVGATPVFVDVSASTLTMCADSLIRAVEHAAGERLRPAAVIAVDLYGQPADYDALSEITSTHELILFVDAAQSLGSTWHNRPLPTAAHAAATSFFPSKPLGCYGDGGAILTNDALLAEAATSLRAHGQGEDKYDNVRIGFNSRLDTIQAAILLAKLGSFGDERDERQQLAATYTREFEDRMWVQAQNQAARSAHAIYTVQVAHRAEFIAELEAESIASAVYYARPLHRQPAYAAYPTDPRGLAESDHAAEHVVSLPMFAGMGEDAQDRVIKAVRAAVDRHA